MFDEIKNKIIGGVVVLVIGGTGFAVSQTDIVSNFAEETGMSQEQAEQYAKDSQDEMESFSKIGDDFINSGNTTISDASTIDCLNYTYEWEDPSLSCNDGKDQLLIIGNGDIELGTCYKTLDTDLGDAAKPKIQECIQEIDENNANYDLPIASRLIDSSETEEMKKSNLYNKSILRAALES